MRAMRLFILAATTLAAPAALGGAACPGDTNADGVVNFLDLNTVLSAFNTSVPSGTGGDVTGDGLVGFADLNIVISSFNVACAFDAQIVAMTRPDLVFAGERYSMTVTIRHNGAAPADIPLRLTVGAGFPREFLIGEVPPGQDAEFPFLFDAPATLPCEDGVPLTIGACLNHPWAPDGDTTNDCAQTQTTLAAAHGDIALEIIASPASAAQCEQVAWTVRARNTGNVPSTPSCLRTGINCFAGGPPGQWSCTMGTQAGYVPPLAPGESIDLPFTLTLPCWALPIEQWIKAMIDTDTGCRDGCPEGDFVQTPVQITPP